VLGPAKDMGRALLDHRRREPGHRDALIWPSLGKSREAFTAMLVAANSYYLSLASASAEEARRNTETIEKTIPVMDRSRRQRPAAAGTAAAGHADAGAARGTGENYPKQLSNRTELLRKQPSTPTQAEAMGAIDDLSVKMRQREQRAQETFDRTLSDISRPGAVDRRDLSRHDPHRRRPDRAPRSACRCSRS